MTKIVRNRQKISSECVQDGPCLKVSQSSRNSFLRRHEGWSRESSFEVTSPSCNMSRLNSVKIVIFGEFQWNHFEPHYGVFRTQGFQWGCRISHHVTLSRDISVSNIISFSPPTVLGRIWSKHCRKCEREVLKMDHTFLIM